MNEYVVILDGHSNRDNEELLYVKKALVFTEELLNAQQNKPCSDSNLINTCVLHAVQQHKYMKRYFNGDQVLTSTYGRPHVVTLTVYDHRGNTHTVIITELLTLEVLDADSNDQAKL